MAIVKRDIPDELEKPVPKKGVKKSTTDAVLGTAVKAGSSVLSVLTGLLAAVMILYSGYVLFDSFYTMQTAAANGWELLEDIPEIIDDGATPLAGGDMLRSINQDYRAWLTVYDSTIDYPVLQGPDDLYYASHDIYGNTSLTGAIYLAAENDPYLRDSYNLVYGHHMDNKAMFGALDAFKDQEYFDSHREGIIVGNSGVYDIEFFAVATGDAYESAIYTVGDRAEEIIAYLASGGTESSGGLEGNDPTISTNVIYFDAAAAAGAEKVIALSTCADTTTNGRLLVFGKMTRQNLLLVDAISYEGIYDGESHSIEAVVSLEEGTTITYSTDGGETWTETPPTITNVGEIKVMIRAENEFAGVAETTATLKVLPRPVTVTAENEFKTYGSPDPSWRVAVSGTLNGDSIAYTVDRTPGENTGSYPIIPTGESTQGNYIVTYVPGNLVITASGTLAVTAIGYNGVYDGQPHYAGYTVNVTDGTVIEYSTDGGVTWTTEVPYIVEPGQIPFLVRASNPNYGTATAAAILIVTAAPEPEENVLLTVIKIWNDNNNADGTRPDQLFMVLSGGGQTRTVQIGTGNNWSASLTMPRYDTAGNEILYSWTEPEVPGYTGTVTTDGNGVTTIVNTRNAQPVNPAQYTLTIHYQYLDGTPVAGDYNATLAQGALIDVTSPVIQGFTATIARVLGVMPGQNTEYVVIYIPADTMGQIDDMNVIIEESRVPLGLGTILINIGDCFE